MFTCGLRFSFKEHFILMSTLLFFHSITFMEGSKTLSSHYVVSVVVQFEVSAISLRVVTAIIVPIHDQLLMIYYSFMLM